MARSAPDFTSNGFFYIEALTHRTPERDGLGLSQFHGHTTPFLV
jgi:hypothetical protein